MLAEAWVWMACSRARRLVHLSGRTLLLACIASLPETVAPMTSKTFPPILADKRYREGSAFTPENLLREARRQKGLTESPVPKVCVLDPDGDIVRRLRADGRARQDPAWACYHTDLYRVT